MVLIRGDREYVFIRYSSSTNKTPPFFHLGRKRYQGNSITDLNLDSIDWYPQRHDLLETGRLGTLYKICGWWLQNPADADVKVRRQIFIIRCQARIATLSQAL